MNNKPERHERSGLEYIHDCFNKRELRFIDKFLNFFKRRKPDLEIFLDKENEHVFITNSSNKFSICIGGNVSVNFDFEGKIKFEVVEKQKVKPKEFGIKGKTILC